MYNKIISKLHLKSIGFKVFVPGNSFVFPLTSTLYILRIFEKKIPCDHFSLSYISCCQLLLSKKTFLAKQLFLRMAPMEAVCVFMRSCRQKPNEDGIMVRGFGFALPTTMEAYNKAEQFLLKAVDEQNIYP